MDYCGAHGIPHSVFLAWHPDDQAKALGWMGEKRQACSQCGTAGWEWEANRLAYSAEPYVCLGCMAIEQTRKDNAEQAKRMPGMHIRLVRNGGVDG